MAGGQMAMSSTRTTLGGFARMAETGLGMAALAPIPGVSLLLRAGSAVSGITADALDHTVSRSQMALNATGHAAGTLASVVPGGAIAEKVVKGARVVSTGVTAIQGINIGRQALKGVSGGETVTPGPNGMTPSKNPNPVKPKRVEH